MEILRQLSLFTGYGGFELGLRLAGVNFRTVGYVEIDEYCQQVIQNRIRDGLLDWAPIIRDVRTADFRPLAGLVDLITAGFPCQPHSVAGKRAGAADRRNLWPDTLRAVREARPGYVLLENAGVHLRNGGQPAYAYTVLADLAQVGYNAKWGLVSAQDAGAPHLRERWFCFAYPDRQRCQDPGRAEPGTQRTQPGPDGRPAVVGAHAGCRRRRAVQPDLPQGQRYPERLPGPAADSDRPRCEERRALPGRSEESAADFPAANAEGPGRRRRSGGRPGNPAQSEPECGNAAAPDAAGRPDGWAGPPREIAGGVPWWGVEPDLVRMVHGGAHRVDRVRALGNGIVPAVVAVFLDGIGVTRVKPGQQGNEPTFS